MKIKKGDTVKILAGADKGKTGKVLRAFPAMDKILVEGVNVKKTHQRARQQGKKGEVVEKSFPIHVSNAKINK